MGLPADDTARNENHSLNRAKGISFSPEVEFHPVRKHSFASPLQWWLLSFGLLNWLCFRTLLLFEYFSSVREQLYPLFSLIVFAATLALFFVGVRPVFSAAMERLNRKELSIEAAYAVALLLSLLSSAYIYIQAGGSARGWQALESNLLLLCVVLLMQSLRSKAVRRLVSRIGFDPRHITGEVRVVEGPRQLEMSVISGEKVDEEGTYKAIDELKAGDVIAVKSGDLLPCDCVVIEGIAELEERKYSGLAAACVKAVGQEVYAGSLIRQGKLVCKVTAGWEDSHISTFAVRLHQQLGELITKLQTYRFYESVYCFILFFLAACGGLYWHERNAGVIAACGVAAAVLLVGIIPAAIEQLRLITALALSCGFRRGLVFKNVGVLNTLCKTKTQAISYSFDDPPGDKKIVRHEILDDRLDKDALLTTFLSLFGGSSEQLDRAVASYLRAQSGAGGLRDISDYHVYPGKGVSGSVEGYELTAGSEDFLLERGVQIQASELVSPEEGEEVIYVAVGDGIVARLYAVPAFDSAGRDLVAFLKRRGVRTVLCSEDSEDRLDQVGKKLELELVDVMGGLDESKLAEKLQSLENAALYSNRVCPAALRDASPLCVEVFDELLWNHAEADITVDGRSLSAVAAAFEVAKSWKQARILNPTLAAILSLLLLILALPGYLSPLSVALSAFFGLLFIWANTERLIYSADIEP